jgi:hypothetical protein
MLSVTNVPVMLSVIMLSVIMLSVIMLSVINAECHHAECHHAECHHAECHHAECHHACAIMLSVIRPLLTLMNPAKVSDLGASVASLTSGFTLGTMNRRAMATACCQGF